MSSVIEIRRHVKWVKEIAQITNALQMVASSKIHRAEKRVEQARPYAESLQSIVAHLAHTLRNEKVETRGLLQQRPVHNIGVILVTPDHSLCGALPSMINRQAMATVQEEQKRLAQQGSTAGVRFIAVGRRGRDFLRRNQEQIWAEFLNYGDWPAYDDAAKIARVAVDAFLKGDVDRVFVVYAKNIDTILQQPIALQILPVKPEKVEQSKKQQAPYIIEGDPLRMLDRLLARCVEVQVYLALLETVASLQAAQMVAMKNATRRSNEMVQDLTLIMNKARQEKITMELLDIINSASLTERGI